MSQSTASALRTDEKALTAQAYQRQVAQVAACTAARGVDRKVSAIPAAVRKTRWTFELAAAAGALRALGTLIVA